MVLADRGLCCIDEFDKMSAEHQALLEAMEQQCVSVAKAGLLASLSARTSVLAAANPVGGHYNRAKTVNENLKMSAALLSLFDLVFILLDKPDELMDKRLSEHIMSLHAGYGEHPPARKKLCRARQLESLVRLAQARARVDLREEITTQDALDVVEIMKESLYDKYVDEHGVVDFGRSGGMSQQKEAKRFLSELNKLSELYQKDCFSISEIYSLADKISLRVSDIDTFVDNLNTFGCLLKKGPKLYQVVSSSYSRTQSTRSGC